MKFTIETVSKMTGIPAASLRNWEKRYGFPKPERTEGGHRFYSAQDVDFLKKAALMMDEGHCLSQIGAGYQKHLCSAPVGLSEGGHAKLAPEILDDVAYRVELLYEALLKFDPTAAQMHYQILNAKLGPEQLFDRVFENLFNRMKADWCDKLISIAQEHYASSFIRLKLSSFLAIDFPASRPQRVLAAAPCGESQEGRLLLVSAQLKFRGYGVYYFGIDLPMTDLISVCEDLDPDVITLSYFSQEKLRQDLQSLKAIRGPVILGGMALCEKEFQAWVREQAPANVYLCAKKVSSEAAHFVEIICQGKKD